MPSFISSLVTAVCPLAAPPSPPAALAPAWCLIASSERVQHRITSGLVEGFSQWWQMPALVLALAAIAAFVVWMYRRDAAELPRGVGLALATLRLAAVAAVVAAYLDFERTAEHEILFPSRVAVLVDSSASMTLRDEPAGERPAASASEHETGTRSDLAIDLLRDGGLLAALAPRHEVSVWRFDADAEPLARLAYDELLAQQLTLALVRADAKRAVKTPRLATGALTEKILDALPFSPTASQETAIAEIRADLARPECMLRLLQGDVGAGKTLVAVMAGAMAIEAGGQAAIMAPTDLLARQHARSLGPLAEAAGIEWAILTGREKGKEREAILEGLASGRIRFLVGTHALFQAPVAFADLALAIVDEQHRFGVHQRLALTSKGQATDLLVMTATPIPRTLMMSFFGDLDVSRLTEKPAGRRPIATRLASADRMGEIVEGLARAISNGAKVYWVSPLVEESETLDLAAAEERFGEIGRAHV